MEAQQAAPEQGAKKKYRVVYHRNECIKVLTCAAAYPQRFVENKIDGLADLEGGHEDPENPGTWLLDFSEEELSKFKEAAEVCPITIIHVDDLETGERII